MGILKVSLRNDNVCMNAFAFLELFTRHGNSDTLFSLITSPLLLYVCMYVCMYGGKKDAFNKESSFGCYRASDVTKDPAAFMHLLPNTSIL